MKAAVALFTCALVAGQAWAGRDCETRPMPPQTLIEGLEQAARTAERLEAEHQRSGAQVVLLARAGQDLRSYGLHYSHVGWAYRIDDVGGQAVWRVVHKLNQCGTDTSAVYRQGLGEFFLDNLWRREAAFVVPTDAMQAGLSALMGDNRRLVRLDEPRYNLVSYPWSTRYQQSNQWAVETMTLAVEPAVRDRRDAQAWLRLHHYEPTVLRISALKRLGGRIGSANIAFDDHPGELRWSNRITTVTADSVFDWMQGEGLSGPVVAIRSTGRTTPSFQEK